MKKKINLNYSYKVEVVYNENYFENKTTNLNQSLVFNSNGRRSVDYIQRLLLHCKVIKIQLIKLTITLN